MRPQKRNGNVGFFVGVTTSLILHLVFAIVVIIALEARAAQAVKVPEIFTVTLEGGEVLGGVDSLPDKIPEKPATETEIPSSAPEPEVAEETEPEPPKEQKQIEEPTVVEQPSEEEIKKKKEAEEKKKKEAEQKKKAEEAKKKKEAEKKKKEAAEQEKKRKEEEARKKKEDEKKAKAARRREFEKRMARRVNASKKRINSESYDAGGSGVMGAAKFQKGGKGRGGGTLTSLAKLTYMKALENHIKSGWRWIDSNQKLTAIVRFRILANGAVQNVRLERTSSSVNFDDSVIRAVTKAAPVPPPPAEFVSDFSDVRITFDSQQ